MAWQSRFAYILIHILLRPISHIICQMREANSVAVHFATRECRYDVTSMQDIVRVYKSKCTLGSDGGKERTSSFELLHHTF